MTLTYHNGISIAEIIIYLPALALAIFLALHHGLGRNSGWLFLITFCLARIIGPCMELATINNPTDISLYTGFSILQSIGLSPLQLATVGFLSRVTDSMNKSHYINTRIFKFVELIILIALILGIVGGINSSDSFYKTGVYHAGPLSKVGTALFVVSWVAIVVITATISCLISHVRQEEKRLLIAIIISLPLLLIRLIYSIMSTFTDNKNFNYRSENITVLLCVVIIEEIIIVIVYEAIGLTLREIPQQGTFDTYAAVDQQAPNLKSAHEQPIIKTKAQATRATIVGGLKHTIIGRLVLRFTRGRNSRDFEMQQNPVLR